MNLNFGSSVTNSPKVKLVVLVPPARTVNSLAIRATVHTSAIAEVIAIGTSERRDLRRTLGKTRSSRER